ncbi:MAG: beta-N-acetylhexosaminidase, partial [Candidatus Cloacimonadota bacterium]
MRKTVLIIIFTLLPMPITDCIRTTMEKGFQVETEISIIPEPQKVEKLSGCFTFSRKTQIILHTDVPEAKCVVQYFADRLLNVAALELRISEKVTGRADNLIIFKQVQNENLGDEGYRLAVGKSKIVLEANQPMGLFYGVQTIFQLLPAEIYAEETNSCVEWKIPCVKIFDKPRYSWRGMMLDVSRHFFPKEFIKDFIDYLAMHKMNKFHLHLNDDQGWRIEIKKYPKLTEIGAWRVDRDEQHWNSRGRQKEGEEATYGGFYTQEDIKEIVAYAETRFITIVPEIEMPGHCLAALAAYPEYSCTGGPFTVPPGGVWPIKDIYCAGSDSTFEFLQGILTEVIALFPGEYVHIGGDEVNKQEWKKCHKCKERIKSEGLKDVKELQSYFTRRIEKFLISKNRRLIGWDEILEGGLAPDATVMSWRGIEGGIEAAQEGHDVVMSPTSHCYFDYYQGEPENEPMAIGGFLPLKKVYSFEPTPEELSSEEAEHILGAQANLWTEFIDTPEHAQYMTFPRIAAIAEVIWSK